MSSRKGEARIAALLQRLIDNPGGRLSRIPGGDFVLSGPGAGRRMRIAPPVIRHLLALGLLREAEPGRLAAAAAARAWLARRADPDQPFIGQHGTVESAAFLAEDGPTIVTMNPDESPLGALSRPGKGGNPWLAAEEIEAAERLRRDFERGQLQPRITANWSASVSSGRRGGGVADLTEMALAARLRFDKAVGAVGPELAGAMVDVCCFLKGLETVERERAWPARSAKLVLRLALAALARHYGLAAEARGAEHRSIRHWGTEDYRPEIS